ncbi:MAG: acyl-homoserine-lactone synthase [Pseudomonadota bacterium]
MLIVLDSENRHRYPALFEEMLAARHDIFVEKYRWADLRSEGGLEYDQFDHPDTIYFLEVNNSGEILGGCRLLKTEGQHTVLTTELGKAVPGLIARPLPSFGASVADLSRFFVREKQEHVGFISKTSADLLSGVARYCNRSRITTLLAVIDIKFASKLIQCGWSVKPLGLPQRYERGWMLAVQIEVSEWTADTIQLAARPKPPKLPAYHG